MQRHLSVTCCSTSTFKPRCSHSTSSESGQTVLWRNETTGPGGSSTRFRPVTRPSWTLSLLSRRLNCELWHDTAAGITELLPVTRYKPRPTSGGEEEAKLGSAGDSLHARCRQLWACPVYQRWSQA